MLHGDLTPGNILDGGTERRLVAIDPAPCLGDAAFDAVDLILWQAGNLDAGQLAVVGLDRSLAGKTSDQRGEAGDVCSSNPG